MSADGLTGPDPDARARLAEVVDALIADALKMAERYAIKSGSLERMTIMVRIPRLEDYGPIRFEIQQRARRLNPDGSARIPLESRDVRFPVHRHPRLEVLYEHGLAIDLDMVSLIVMGPEL